MAVSSKSSLPFSTTDLDLRAKMMWAKDSLADHLIHLNGLELYEPIQPMLCRRLKIGSRELMVLFREFGKSTLAEQLAVNEMAFVPGSFVLYFSTTDDTAVDHILAARHEFEETHLEDGRENPFHELVPKPKIRWKDNDFILKNGNRMTGGGVGKGVLGKRQLKMRPTLIIVDDPVPKEAGDDKRIIQWFRQTILPMGSPKTRIIMIGTPRRYQDIIMEYMHDEDESFKVHHYPAVYEDGTVSCPSFWLREGSCCIESRLDEDSRFKCGHLTGEALIDAHIEQKKREVKSIAWSTEYMLNPTDDGSSLFPMALLEKSRNKQWTFEASRARARQSLVDQARSGVIPYRIPCVIGCDHAISESAEADFSVFTVMSCEPNKPRRLLDRFKGRGISFGDQKVILKELNNLYKPLLILSESNSFQVVFSQDLAKHSNMPIAPYNTGSEKNTYEVGIPSLKTNFENGNYEVPYGDKETKDYVDTLFRQLNGFIYEDGKVVSVTKYDDCGLSWWLADTAAREVSSSSVSVFRGTSMTGGRRDSWY